MGHEKRKSRENDAFIPRRLHVRFIMARTPRGTTVKLMGWLADEINCNDHLQLHSRLQASEGSTT
jgi:hypothetical protein